MTDDQHRITIAPDANITVRVVDDPITISREDAQRLFDLATDSPLICSGSFETDDVVVLRRLAQLIGVVAYVRRLRRARIRRMHAAYRRRKRGRW